MAKARGTKRYDKSKIQRDNVIIFRASDEEKRKLTEAANRLGISVGAYIRLVVLNKKGIFGGETDVHK